MKIPSRSDIIQNKTLREFIKYGLVGVVGLIIDMGVYYILFDKLGVNYLISSVVGGTLAIINNFILNSYLTFKVTDQKFKRFVSFASIACIGIVVQTGLLALFVSVIGLDKMLGKALAILIVAMVQFIVNKLFTFKKR